MYCGGGGLISLELICLSPQIIVIIHWSELNSCMIYVVIYCKYMWNLCTYNWDIQSGKCQIMIQTSSAFKGQLNWYHMYTYLWKAEFTAALTVFGVWCVVEEELLANGFLAYTTSCGWLGYSDEKIKKVVNFLTTLSIKY